MTDILAGRYEESRLAMEQARLRNPAFPYPLKDIAVMAEKPGQHRVFPLTSPPT